MHFRLIATERRTSPLGTHYQHTIWMGQFDSFDTEEDEAVALARTRVGANCIISVEEIPTTLH